jgi:hypothetical protein
MLREPSSAERTDLFGRTKISDSRYKKPNTALGEAECNRQTADDDADCVWYASGVDGVVKYCVPCVFKRLFSKCPLQKVVERT